MSGIKSIFSLFAVFPPEQQDSLCSKKGTMLSEGICLRVTGLLQAYTTFDEYHCREILFTRTVLGLGVWLSCRVLA